eukprot:11525575-Karenia_brevis.AAC.1
MELEQAISHVPSSMGLTCVARDPRIAGTLSLKILSCSSRIAKERWPYCGGGYYFYYYDTGYLLRQQH